MGTGKVWLTRNPWQHINDNAKWADDSVLKGLSADTYHLILSIGLGVITASVVVLWLKWGMHKKEDGAMNRRNAIVSPLLFKLFLVMLITCLPYLLGEVFRIINSVAKAFVS